MSNSTWLLVTPAAWSSNPASDKRLRCGDLGVLDTAPEAEFDDLAKLAAIICQAPIALGSLVDQDRHWVGRLPRCSSFPSHHTGTHVWDDMLFSLTRWWDG